MTTARHNLIKAKNYWLWLLAETDRAIAEIARSGTASASLSAGGGSQSYTHADLDKLEKLRGKYAARISAINQALAGGNMTGIRHVITTRIGGRWY